MKTEFLRIILCSLLFGCASQVREPPVVLPWSPPSVVTIDAGLAAHQADNCRAATEIFTALLATDRLNNLGKSIVYWHLADCARMHLSSMTTVESLFPAETAFLGFLVVAEDLIEDPPDNNFIEDFELHKRMVEANAYLHTSWAMRSRTYGRELDVPIIVQNVREIEYFAYFMSQRCGGKCDIERNMLSKDGKPVTPHTERVIVVDKQQGRTFIYYLAVKEHQYSREGK